MNTLTTIYIGLTQADLIDKLVTQLSDQRTFYMGIVLALVGLIGAALWLQWYFTYKQVNEIERKLKDDFRIEETEHQIAILVRDSITQKDIDKLKEDIISRIETKLAKRATVDYVDSEIKNLENRTSAYIKEALEEFKNIKLNN